MQHDARYVHLASGTLNRHSLGQLIQGCLARPVAVPATQAVVTDAAHSGTQVGYDRRSVPESQTSSAEQTSRFGELQHLAG